jgi:FHA domain
VAKFRLRFLMQELDLPLGTTVLGRSTDCEITIEDPLVSRQHARIVIAVEGAFLHDLGSRNGVKLNGTPISEATRLKDGDRVRVGAHEFVFCVVDPDASGKGRTTGALRHCAKCRLPYPKEVAACPNCGTSEPTDDDTLEGPGSRGSSYSIQMLIDVLDKALSLSRITDAERILRRATGLAEEHIAGRQALDPRQLAAIAAAATRVAAETRSATWGQWAADVYRRASLIPPAEVAERLGQLGRQHREVAESVEALVRACRSLSPVLSAAEERSLALLGGASH